MKIVVYSTQRSGFLKGREYRNPMFFNGPQGRPDKVVVVGDWPSVQAAYEKIGVDVVAVPKGAELPTFPTDLFEKAEETGEAETGDEEMPLNEMTVKQLQECCKQDGVEYKPSWDKARLIQALTEEE